MPVLLAFDGGTTLVAAHMLVKPIKDFFMMDRAVGERVSRQEAASWARVSDPNVTAAQSAAWHMASGPEWC